eukprot:5111902-Alexandrium_andersonii.AAC.1
MCGCGGWCSHYELFTWLRWSLEALAVQRWPENRHDGVAFGPHGTHRRANAAQPMTARMAVV